MCVCVYVCVCVSGGADLGGGRGGLQAFLPEDLSRRLLAQARAQQAEVEGGSDVAAAARPGPSLGRTVAAERRAVRQGGRSRDSDSDDDGDGRARAGGTAVEDEDEDEPEDAVTDALDAAVAVRSPARSECSCGDPAPP
jgi:hypothetical protein